MAIKKAGRRGQWNFSLLDDFVDIIVNNENYKKRLTFQNTKYQQNGVLYNSILQEPKRTAAARGDVVEFTVSQLHNKFKKCVGNCKKAALMIKTATGGKRFPNERGFGVWFDHLFALIKTKGSCNPDKVLILMCKREILSQFVQRRVPRERRRMIPRQMLFSL